VISLATTYTINAGLQMPAASDRNWDVPLNANAEILDGISAIGGLAVTLTEYPSATLQVAVAPGNFINSKGIVVSFAGQSPVAIPASSTVDLWLNDAGAVNSGSSFPTSAHLRLAQVVSGPTSIDQIIDQRVPYSVMGTGLGFVLKAGDIMSGALTISSPSSGSAVLVADPVNALVGFFGVSPASQAASLNSLTSSSSGVASNTISDVGPSFSQSVLNDNFASLAAKVDALIAVLKLYGLMAP
jgi:hypothetical protein